jgi:hypothetical protein
MAGGFARVELSENHRRPISALPRQLESACAAIEAWMNRASGPLLRLEDDLHPEQLHQLREKLPGVRAAIGQAMRQFGLPPQKQSRRAAIVALLSVNCANLEDTLSYNPRGYGQLAPEAAQQIDAHMGRLLGLLEEMLSLTERPKEKE